MIHIERRRLAMLGVVVLLATAALPVGAQVHVVQNSCQTDGVHPSARFSFVSLPTTSWSVCQITIVPTSAECFPLQCVAPDGWTCFPGDVTTFFQANDNDACLAPGETQSGFELQMFGATCCFRIGYFSSAGTPLADEEFCFDCTKVGVETETWGGAKRLYD